jgi:hypothetical protein
MIMDVVHHRLFKPPQINDNPPEACRQFLKLTFSNKGIDTVTVRNILCHKKVKSCIPEFVKSKSTPCIAVVFKLFGYHFETRDFGKMRDKWKVIGTVARITRPGK